MPWIERAVKLVFLGVARYFTLTYNVIGFFSALPYFIIEKNP